MFILCWEKRVIISLVAWKMVSIGSFQFCSLIGDLPCWLLWWLYTLLLCLVFYFQIVCCCHGNHIHHIQMMIWWLPWRREPLSTSTLFSPKTTMTTELYHAAFKGKYKKIQKNMIWCFKSSEFSNNTRIVIFQICCIRHSSWHINPSADNRNVDWLIIIDPFALMWLLAWFTRTYVH